MSRDITLRLSAYCASGAVCALCRSRGANGSIFRQSIIDAPSIDFECPHGLAWGAESKEWTPDMPSRGVGDVVAKVTNAVGIKPCGGCKDRQAWLNKHFPLKAKE